MPGISTAVPIRENIDDAFPVADGEDRGSSLAAIEKGALLPDRTRTYIYWGRY